MCTNIIIRPRSPREISLGRTMIYDSNKLGKSRCIQFLQNPSSHIFFFRILSGRLTNPSVIVCLCINSLISDNWCSKTLDWMKCWTKWRKHHKCTFTTTMYVTKRYMYVSFQISALINQVCFKRKKNCDSWRKYCYIMSGLEEEKTGLAIHVIHVQLSLAD